VVGKGEYEGGEGQTQHKSGGCVGDDVGGNSPSLPLFLVFLGMEKCVCAFPLPLSPSPSLYVLGGAAAEWR